uniref:hypothetical protein n=1 Tax=Rickettsia endosymbiont of Oedothorax gibbosus TaxID=931099 RepID=UPI002024D21F|nr:hypothetical protein [Rickettsia endosymbiont of Oedothorax gibbosus]
MIPLTEIFCLIDDFCKHFDTEQNKYILPNPNRKRKVVCSIGLSEIITIIVMFHLSHYRTFKDFYLCCLIAIIFYLNFQKNIYLNNKTTFLLNKFMANFK